MNTIALESFAGDWRAAVADVQHTGAAVALSLDGKVCGMLLPEPDARRDELRQAIGRWFSNVDFIPARPKDFVERKH